MIQPLSLPQLPPVERRRLTENIRHLDRRLSCNARTASGTCACVDQSLGWLHGLPMDQCDQCHTLGPDTESARSYREGLVSSAVSRFLSILPECPPSIIKALLSLHVPRARAEELMADPNISFALSREKLWAAVRHSWEEADSVRTLGLGAFLASLSSRGFLNNRVTNDVLNTRTISCTGRDLAGNTVAAPCPSLVTGRDQGLYCGACGCAQSPLSRLDGGDYPKLHYPSLQCPRRRPGFSNEAPSVPE